MKKRGGLTLVEILISLGLISMVLIAPLYTFMTRSFSFGKTEVKNLDSIQELTFIVNHLRFDLMNLIEFKDNKDSYMKFDSSTKTLDFMVVSGFTGNGMQIVSKAKYYFKNRELHKTYVGLSGETIDKVLSKPGNISKFEVEILDIKGERINESRSDGRIPAYVNVVLNHSCSARIKVNTNIYLSYMRDMTDSLDNHRLWGWKIRTTSSYLMAMKTNIGNLLIDLRPIFQMLAQADMLRKGTNMGVSQHMQMPVVKLKKPFCAAKPGDPNPYLDPPPPPPPPRCG